MSFPAAVLLLLVASTAACAVADPPDVEAAVLEVVLTGCQLNTSDRATATAVGDGLALTVAHAFDEASAVVVVAPNGAELSAELVYIDTERDIALLSFDNGTAEVATLEVRSDDDDPADEGRIVVRREDDTIVQPVELLRRTAVTLDGEGRREGIELGGVIELGDSGAPLIDQDGGMIGMVFASSRSADTGWAVAGSELLDIASLAGSPIPLTCSLD